MRRCRRCRLGIESVATSVWRISSWENRYTVSRPCVDACINCAVSASSRASNSASSDANSSASITRRSNRRPTTAPAASTVRASAPTRSNRRPMTSRTPSGTSSWSTSRSLNHVRSASKSLPSSSRWRNTSSTKNGLPSVSRRITDTSRAGGSPPPSTASRSRSADSENRRSEIRRARRCRFNVASVLAKGSLTSSSTSRYVPMISIRWVGRCCARCSSSSSVGSSAQCRSSSRHTNGEINVPRSTNSRYPLNRWRRCCSGGSSMTGGISGKILRSCGMMRATSGAASPRA